MKVIQPNCRVQFTAADIEFICRQSPAQKTGDRGLRHQTSSPIRTAATPSSMMKGCFHALLENRGLSHRLVAPLFFYVLVRKRVAARAGIDDRIVADYVAEISFRNIPTSSAHTVVLPGEGRAAETISSRC